MHGNKKVLHVISNCVNVYIGQLGERICNVKTVFSVWKSYFDQSLKTADQAESHCVSIHFEVVLARTFIPQKIKIPLIYSCPACKQGIQIAIKTRASERCREMDLHPNSSRVLALTLLRIGSESNSRKSSLLNCKPQYFNEYCKLSMDAQLRLCAWC